MDGTWKGGREEEEGARRHLPLPRQIGRGKRSCHTKRGEEREKKEGGELKGIWEERGSEGEPGPPGSAAPSTEMQQRAVDGIVSTRRLSTVLEASKATST